MWPIFGFHHFIIVQQSAKLNMPNKLDLQITCECKQYFWKICQSALNRIRKLDECFLNWAKHPHITSHSVNQSTSQPVNQSVSQSANWKRNAASFGLNLLTRVQCEQLPHKSSECFWIIGSQFWKLANRLIANKLSTLFLQHSNEPQNKKLNIY